MKRVQTMKKRFKKVTAIALAFSLIGAETAITKTIAPQANNSVTAYAATCHNCHGGSLYVTTYEKTEEGDVAFPSDQYPFFYFHVIRNYRIEECTLCHTVISKTLVSSKFV